MKRLDTEEADQWINVGLYGPPGTGKTTFGVTASGLGPVLILLSEHQGMVHIREAANRLGCQLPRVLQMDDVQDYRDVLRALWGDRSKPFRVTKRIDDKMQVVAEWETWPETVVIDSATDLCARLIVADIRRRAPQSAAEDGLPKDAERFFTTLGDMADNIIKSYRDAPCHTIFLCLQNDRTIGKGKREKRQTIPKFPMHALAFSVAAAVNAMGRTYRVANDGRVEYAVALTGPDFHECLKQCAPLRNVEVANFTSWVKRLQDIEVQLEPADATPDAVPEDFEGLRVPEGMDGADTSAEGGGHAPEQPQEETLGGIVCEACGEKPVDIEGQLCEGCEPPQETPAEATQRVEDEMERQATLLDKITVPEAIVLVKTSLGEGLLRTWLERDSRKGVVDAIDARLKALAKGRATVARAANV